MTNLSPTDETIVALSQEGRNDAEIAVRLGLTVGDVRERRERLRASDPAPVPKPPPTHSRRRIPRWLLALAAIFVAGWVAFALYLRFSSGGSATTSAAATIELGRVVLTPHGEAIQVDERPAMTVLTVPDGTVIRSADKKAWSQTNNAPNTLLLSTEVDGAPLRVLFFRSGSDAAFSADWSGGVRVSQGEGNGNPLQVFIIGAAPNGDLHTVHGGANGVLTVARAPVEKRLVVNASTRETLDLNNAAPLGKLPGGATTDCGNAATPRICAIRWFPSDGDLASPFAGNLSCVDDGTWRLYGQATGYTLHFRSTGGACGRTLQATKLPVTVQAGEKLAMPPGVFDVTAVSSDGHPVSLAVATDGTLYAGKITPKVGCPCIGTP